MQAITVKKGVNWVLVGFSQNCATAQNVGDFMHNLEIFISKLDNSRMLMLSYLACSCQFQAHF